MKQEEHKWNEKLWKPIIRPQRYSYQLSGLGSESFMVQGIIVKRFDFTIKNNRNLILQCSLFEPIKLMDKPHPCIIYLHGNSGSRIESHSIIDYVIPSYISVCGIDLSGIQLLQQIRIWIIIRRIYILGLLGILRCLVSVQLFERRKSIHVIDQK
ncbi:unnamed protein product [Paramecium primaurelia]|uniref:Uncharacterized protein n=1 Tax=Paramecium primaurelia TaxID=5886 RepID=A0A8S1LUA4_PARPR|nr:unnamed protein product [Paramecium primaurelia]